MPDVILQLIEPANVTRLVVLAAGAFLIGFSAAVMVEASKFRAPPRHVAMIAISYSLLVFAVSLEIIGRWDRPFTWQTAMGGISFAFGIYSMWLMYDAYRYAHRLRRHEKAAVREGNRIMGEVFRRQHSEDEGDPGAGERRRET